MLHRFACCSRSTFSNILKTQPGLVCNVMCCAWAQEGRVGENAELSMSEWAHHWAQREALYPPQPAPHPRTAWMDPHPSLTHSILHCTASFCVFCPHPFSPLAPIFALITIRSLFLSHGLFLISNFSLVALTYFSCLLFTLPHFTMYHASKVIPTVSEHGQHRLMLCLKSHTSIISLLWSTICTLCTNSQSVQKSTALSQFKQCYRIFTGKAVKLSPHTVAEPFCEYLQHVKPWILILSLKWRHQFVTHKHQTCQGLIMCHSLLASKLSLAQVTSPAVPTGVAVVSREGYVISTTSLRW